MDDLAQQPDLEQTPPSIEDKEQALSVLQNELAQSEAALEENFAKWCASSLNADDEELFFEDKEAFIRGILEKQNAFIMQELGEKSQRAKQLENEIGNDKAFAEVEGAQQRFLEANPSADIGALLDFYEQDLPPRYKAELEALNPDEFFTALNEIYNAYQGGSQSGGSSESQANKEAQLPKQIQGVPSSAEGGGNADLMMNRF